MLVKYYFEIKCIKSTNNIRVDTLSEKIEL